MTRWWIPVVVALLGCTRDGDSRKEPKPPVPVPVPDPLPRRPAEDPGRVLILHDNPTEGQPSYLAITLPDDPKATPAFEDLGERGPISSHHKTRWAHADESRVTIGVPSMTSGGKPAVSVAVPAKPAALRVVGDAVYVGMAGAFGWIDAGAAKPVYVELVKRDHPYKPYDRFAREGDRLLAIDDEVMPIYADWYAIDRAGKPTKRLADWTLPNVVNGHYMKAVLLPSGKTDFTLYLLAWYSVRTGDGHVLMAVPVKNDQLEFDRNITLPNRDGKLAVIGEFGARSGAGRKDELLVGDKLTQWMDLAIARRTHKLLIAALDRGMFVVPADFGPRAKPPEVVDLGGTVWAVHAHGERLFALVVVEGGKGELVELDPQSLQPKFRHALPRPFHGFVD